MLMNASGGGAVQQVGQRFGLTEEQTSSALGQLVPALLAGLQNNTAQSGGLESLLGALNGGNHAQYLDRPELLTEETTAADGNSILGHIFGSKDVSRAVAARASEQTGIGSDILKQMLPVVATMVMGGLSRQNGLASQDTSQAGSLLTSLLDQNRSGSIADEVVGMLGRFLSRGQA
jgi:hypothetical protein